MHVLYACMHCNLCIDKHNFLRKTSALIRCFCKLQKVFHHSSSTLVGEIFELSLINRKGGSNWQIDLAATPRLLTPGALSPSASSLTRPMESPAISTGEWLEDGQMYKMHRPHVYKAFPRMLQPLDSVAPAVLWETRGRRWREQAMRIRYDALSWTQCTREWREVEEDAAREEGKEGPKPFSHSRWYARMCKDHVDWSC